MEQTNPEKTTSSEEQNQEQAQSQPQNQSGGYQQPPLHRQTQESSPVSLNEWVVTLIIMAIPFVNIVMLFVWGFSDNTKLSKANWAKASLIVIAALFVLYIILFAAMGIAFTSSAL